MATMRTELTHSLEMDDDDVADAVREWVLKRVNCEGLGGESLSLAGRYGRGDFGDGVIVTWKTRSEEAEVC